MFSYIYHTLIATPLYNGLIFLMDIIPWVDAGVAVVLFTIVVRLILFPLSKKAVTAQIRMKEIEPELNKIKEQYKDDRQLQAVKMMELYKSKKFNPFSSILLLFIQLPILFALYSIFVNSGLPSVNAEKLYSFVSIPHVDMNFLGLVDIAGPSIILSLIAAASQFFQLHYSVSASPKPTNIDKTKQPNAQDIANQMTRNMKYIFPVIVFLISYKISAAIAIYWSISSLFTLAQELYIRHKYAVSRSNQQTTS
jgi:YidC/Oxa1 family membrane protein insertase